MTAPRVIFVYGTKGGVGKSTVSTNLAFAMGRLGARPGLVDLDVSGPNVPLLIAGLEGRAPRMVDFRLKPGVYGDVAVSSLGFFVEPQHAPYLTGRYLEGAVEQLVFHDGWDDCDVMVVDLPPGFSELHRMLFTRLPGEVVLVSTPHTLSTQDLGRGRALLAELGASVRGAVLSMTHMECGSCGARTDLFGDGGADAIGDVPVIARIPYVREAGLSPGGAVPAVLVDDERLADFQDRFADLARLLLEGADAKAA